MHQGPWKYPKFLISNLRSHTQDNPILPLTNIIYYAQFLVSFLSFLGKKKCIVFCFKVGKESNHNYIYECWEQQPTGWCQKV